MNCDLRYNEKKYLTNENNPGDKKAAQVQRRDQGDRRQRWKERIILFLVALAFVLFFFGEALVLMR